MRPMGRKFLGESGLGTFGTKTKEASLHSEGICDQARAQSQTTGATMSATILQRELVAMPWGVALCGERDARAWAYSAC